jgi:hypothetical protein
VRHRQSIAATVLIVAAALAATACGTPAPAPSHPGSSAGRYPNACGLLTKADAERVLGAPVPGEPESTQDADGGMCLYSIEAEGASVQLQVGDPKITRLAAGGTEPVSGIGDEAFGNNGELWLRKGDVGLILLAINPIRGLAADTTIQLARTVLARM